MLRRRDEDHLWSAQRGAVYAEALVCFPAFLALLMAVLAFHGMYSAKLEAKARARRVAWLQADSGDCAQRTCPECEPDEQRLGMEGLDPLNAVRAEGRSLDKFTGRISKLLWGRSADGLGEASAVMPGGMGQSEARMHGLTTLPCNTRGDRGPNADSALQEACDGGLSGMEFATGACGP